MSDLEIQRHSVHTLVFRSLKRSHDMFISDQMQPLPSNPTSDNIRLSCKIRDGYKHVKERVEREVKRIEIETNTPATAAYNGTKDNEKPLAIEASTKIVGTHEYPSGQGKGQSLTSSGPNDSKAIQLLQKDGTPTFSSLDKDDRYKNVPQGKTIVTIGDEKMLVPRKAPTMAKPNWHPPWKLYRVISGHLGWVRCIAFEPGNEWFVTGASDRMIKIWDLASGQLKLSLTGHISSVRGLAVSSRQPYLFSCGEDKQVKCWDLEYNKVVRHYHGHLSAIYALDLHPTLDVLVTSGRDSTARVWDMRTKAQIHALTGHSNTVATVKCQNANPQVITGSHDSTIRLWDLVSGRSNVTLTNHKKSVRAIALHPSQYTMASASPDNIKQWKFPDGNFIQNCSGHNSIVNCLAVNQDGVMVSGGDNGSMHFFDWKTGYNFQRMQSLVQPGSLDSEAGIFAASFDHSGSRLLTGEADKSIKIYKEDDSASEETHPINWRPDILKRKRF